MLEDEAVSDLGGRDENHRPQPWITQMVAVAVTVGWLGSLAIGFATNDYTPLTIVTPVVVILAGYAFGVQIIKRANGKK